MTLGGISLARRIEVYSRTGANEDFLYTIFDEQQLRTEGSIEPKATSLGEFHLPREILGKDGQTADVVIRMSLLPAEWRTTAGAGGNPEAKKRKIDKNEPLCGNLADSETNQERQDIKNAILLLLFSYVKAESMFDNHEILFEALRSQWGTALATALSEYDREARS